MSRARLWLFATAAALLLAVSPAQADAGKVKRLEDAVVIAIPMGDIFALMGGGHADWPRRLDPSLGAGQSACLASELSVDGERRRLRPLVTRYVADHPGRIDDDLALLELVGPIMGRMMLGGAVEEQTGQPFDSDALVESLSEAEAEGFVALVADARYVPLRELLGIGNMFNPEASQAENEAAGEAVGEDIAVRILRRAYANCDVPFPID